MQAVVAWKRQSSHLYHPHPQVSSLFWAGLQRESARTPRHHGPDLHSTPTENQAAIINNARQRGDRYRADARVRKLMRQRMDRGREADYAAFLKRKSLSITCGIASNN
jgi:hypothetical protein